MISGFVAAIVGLAALAVGMAIGVYLGYGLGGRDAYREVLEWKRQGQL